MGCCGSKADPGQGPTASEKPNSASPAPAQKQEVKPASGPSAAKPSAPTTKHNFVLGKDTPEISTEYNLGKILGKGQFGTTRRAVHKGTGEVYACKSISKRKLTNEDDIEDVRREVQIMHHLAGHPNIVLLKGAYEDKQYVHLVMELCSGGELFDRIVSQEHGHYTEKDAATLVRTMTKVIAHCHHMGVIHRDLKPENFLLYDTSPAAVLKCTDFGLSVFFRQDQMFDDVVGSAYYVAPEVLRRKYSYQADIWSVGVILYILLTGQPPFYGQNETDIFKAILNDPVGKSLAWPSEVRLTEEAKDCVVKMLVRDPLKRATADEVLNHRWLKENGLASDTPLDNAVLTRMRGFSAMNKLKKNALKIIASSLPAEEIEGLKSMFKGIDKDQSGTISVDELRSTLKTMGTHLSDAEMSEIMDATDVDGNGQIDYEEFLAATMHLSKVEKADALAAAFARFDTDNSGYITLDEIKGALGSQLSDDEVKMIVAEIDMDSDGKIDYEEFTMMMLKGNEDAYGISALRHSMRF